MRQPAIAARAKPQRAGHGRNAADVDALQGGPFHVLADGLHLPAPPRAVHEEGREDENDCADDEGDDPVPVDGNEPSPEDALGEASVSPFCCVPIRMFTVVVNITVMATQTITIRLKSPTKGRKQNLSMKTPKSAMTNVTMSRLTQ